jgi:hypothetical protein
MAKHRKTREQKKLADLRHSFRHILVSQTPSAAKIQFQQKATISLSNQANPRVLVSAYPYLVKDLSKTGMLTLGILVFQVVLFALLKNHVLTIPGIGF